MGTLNKFGIHSTRVLIENKLQEATVVILGEKIDSIILGTLKPSDFSIKDHGNLVIMPGLIDSHVHINEPGRAEWEGFDTATKAAAAGGITTLVDMPLNSSPVTINVKTFQEKISASEKKLHVNCGFYGGLIPSNIEEIDALLSSGILGIKAFLTHSGIDEFPNVTESDLRKALPIIKKHNAILLVHCELESENSEAHLLDENPTSYQAYLKSRPRKWEDDAIELMIRLSKEYDVRIHVVHLSSSNSIEKLKRAQAEGIPITVETCVQYLCLDAENIPDADTRFKCAPPIREKENNDQLWQAIKDGLIDFVITDHSPAPPEIKELESGNFKKAWGGIASLQFSLPVFWTKAQEKGFSIEQTVQLMSENVASFLQLDSKKGKLQKGYDADITIWNPEEEFIVLKENILFRHKLTPYEGMRCKGVIKQTYVNGGKVFEKGEFKKLNLGGIAKSSIRLVSR